MDRGALDMAEADFRVRTRDAGGFGSPDPMQEAHGGRRQGAVPL